MRRLLFLSMCGILCGQALCFADSLKRHDFSFGTEVSSFKYEEPGVMEEKGVMTGFTASYTYHNGLMANAEGRFALGEVDYTSGETGSIDGIDDYLFEVRGLGGYDWPIFQSSYLTPFFGLGFRYLNDDSSGMNSSTGAAGYERESNYFYSPLGAQWLLPLKNEWRLLLSGEYDFFWWGVQESHLSGAVSSLNDIENDQDSGRGARAAIALQKETQKIDYRLEAFFRYWDIDQSEDAAVSVSGTIIGRAFEPANETTEFGARLTLAF